LLSEMIFPLFVLGRWDEAVERGSQIPENEMVLADIMNPLLSLPIIYVSRQDLEGAKRLLSIFSRFESSEDVQESAAHAVARATVHRAEGRLQEAQIASGKAIELARRIGPSSQMLVVGLDEALEAAFARGELAKVEELLMSVSDLQSAEVTPTLRAIETRFQARLSEARELGSRAEDAFKCAVGMFRDIGAVYWMAATLTEYGEFLLRQDRGGEAVPQLEEARTIFEQLRARTWLERAVALPARASSAGSDEWP
jgi:tetratricopeptide (TPR) repeat protein